MRNFNVSIPTILRSDMDSLYKNRIENKFDRELCAMTVQDGKISTVMTVRWYERGEMTTHCCVWIHGMTEAYAGGKSVGLGYDRRHASFAQAIKNMGIDHDCTLSGESVTKAMIEEIIALIAPEIDYIHFHSANA